MLIIRIARRALLLLVAVGIVTAPAGNTIALQTAIDSGPTQSQDTLSRADIMAIARRYAQHRWEATAANVHHGPDLNGNQVDTPDESYRKGGFVPESENTGIPYQWGGFSSIEEFDLGIRLGKYAGHLPQAGSSPASPQAVGVDCSGFVSRCWDLPRKHSTRSLGNICYELGSFFDLESGDIINSFDGHVVLFDSFADADRKTVAVYEAGGTRVEKNVYSISWLQKKGFKPLRYKPLDEQWSRQTLAPASFSIGEVKAGLFEPSGNPPLDFDILDNPMKRAIPGEWARYNTGPSEESLLSISTIDSDRIVIRNRFSRRTKVQLNERESSVDNAFLQALIDFGGFDQDFGELSVVQSEVQPGKFHLGEQTFDARKIRLEYSTTLLSRQIHYPVSITLDCVISEQVPLCGVIEGRFKVVIKRDEEVIGMSIKRFELQEFYREPDDDSGD